MAKINHMFLLNYLCFTRQCSFYWIFPDEQNNVFQFFIIFHIFFLIDFVKQLFRFYLCIRSMAFHVFSRFEQFFIFVLHCPQLGLLWSGPLGKKMLHKQPFLVFNSLSYVPFRTSFCICLQQETNRFCKSLFIMSSIYCTHLTELHVILQLLWRVCLITCYILENKHWSNSLRSSSAGLVTLVRQKMPLYVSTCSKLDRCDQYYVLIKILSVLAFFSVWSCF